MSGENWCHVCNETKENHDILKCDGETCIYCQKRWDECYCGIGKERK